MRLGNPRRSPGGPVLGMGGEFACYAIAIIANGGQGGGNRGAGDGFARFRFALGDAGWKTSLKSDDLKPEEQTGQEVRSGHGEPAG